MDEYTKEYEYYFHFAMKGGFSGVIQVQTIPAIGEDIDDWIAREIETARASGAEYGLQHFAGTADDILVASIHREEKEKALEKEKVVDAPKGGEGKDQVVFPFPVPPEVANMAEGIRKELERRGLSDVQIKEISPIEGSPPPDIVKVMEYHAARAEEMYAKIDEALSRFTELIETRERGNR